MQVTVRVADLPGPRRGQGRSEAPPSVLRPMVFPARRAHLSPVHPALQGLPREVGERPPDLHAEARSPGNAGIAQRPSRPGLRLQASPRPDDGTGISLARAVMMALAHAGNSTSDAEPRPRNGTSNPIPADPARHAGPRVHEARLSASRALDPVLRSDPRAARNPL